MKFSAVAALLAFAASASAQGISVINPTLGAVWYSGQTNSITWTVSNATTITSIILRQGQSTNLNTVATISNAQLDATVGKYDWAIDSSIPSGADYAVQVTTEQGQAYSPYFTVLNNGTPAPSGSIAPGKGPVSSGAAAPGSASGSASGSGTGPAPSTPADSGAAAVKATAALGLAAGAVAVALF